MLYPLGKAHPQDGEVGSTVTGADLLPEQQEVVYQHEPDSADDQHQVDPAHPAVDLLAHAGSAAGGRGVHMHLALCEVIRRARMTLPARNHQIGLVNA